MSEPSHTIGVVIVSFNSGDELCECLESLLSSEGITLNVVIVDNASTNDTLARLRSWAEGSHSIAQEEYPFPSAAISKPIVLWQPEASAGAMLENRHRVTLIEADSNGGYAAGVNLGLKHLSSIPQLDLFWVLNPDTIVPPETASALVAQAAAADDFSLMGGRVLYLTAGHTPIQSDGGRIDRGKGLTHSVHQFRDPAETPAPDPGELDFVTGASMVASRAFLERAGLMEEDYFLYYEEVDWAMKRGDLPLAVCPEAVVYHRAGTAIGSGKPGRPATPFSLYFMHRNRHRFVRRHFPESWPGAYAYSLAKAGQLVLKGQFTGAGALLRGAFGLGPPKAVRERLSPEAQALAFAPERR